AGEPRSDDGHRVGHRRAAARRGGASPAASCRSEAPPPGRAAGRPDGPRERSGL
ncbi:MAG: hypothetical protein AVDCRST_MAG52-230, partial [uncultured Blastococcus sp.]